MAEHSFREVMHEINRLCMAQNNCDNDCPLENMGCCGNLGAHCSNPLQVERIEKTVMSWAAEHPEPVYTNWIDWLMSESVIPTNYMAANSTDSGVSAGTFYVTRKAFEPIPADIAEKLGIEPKEG